MSGSLPRAGDIGLLYGIYFAFVGASGPWFPLLFDQWGMTAFQIGALVALSHLIRIVAPPVWGWAADRRGQTRSLLLAGAGIMTAMCLVLPQAGGLDPAQRFLAAALVMAVLHLAAAGQGPLTESMSLRLADGDFGLYGRMRVWGSLGFILAVAGLGPVLDAYGVSLLPFLLAAIAASLALAVRRLPPGETPRARRHLRASTQRLDEPDAPAFRHPLPGARPVALHRRQLRDRRCHRSARGGGNLADLGSGRYLSGRGPRCRIGCRRGLAGACGHEA